MPPDVPGALEYAVTSDDLFTLKKPPGKSSHPPTHPFVKSSSSSFNPPTSSRQNLVRGRVLYCPRMRGFSH